jgi:ATP-binding cassette subfamily C protein
VDRTPTVKILLGIYKRGEKMKRNLKLIVLCFPLALSAFVNVYFAFVLQKVIDITSSGDVKKLVSAIIFALFYLLLDILLSLVVKYLSGKFIQSEVLKLKKNKVDNNLKHPCNMNELSSRLTLDIELLARDYFQQKINVIFNGIQIIFGLIAIIYISFVLTLGIGIVTLIPLVVPILFKNKVKEKKESFLNESEKYTEFLKELESGKFIISDYSLSTLFSKRHDFLNKKLERARFKSRFIEGSVDVITMNLGMLTFIAALGIGSYYVILGKMTFGLMIAAIQLLNSIVQPLNYLSHSFNRMNSTQGILKEYKVSSKGIDDSLQDVESIKSIELKNISYNYPDGTEGIKNLSAVFEKGKSYIIEGDSGSGKSTILKLLTGDYKPDSGEILINGISMNMLSMESIKSRIGVTRQDVFLFKDDIRNNITLWSDYTAADYDEVVGDASLEEVIDGCVEKNVSNEKGLSGGQRQRIGVARALLKKSDVLIMDEVTSSLDDSNAEKVINNILRTKDSIKICVTHNELLKINFDEIIRISAV